MHRETTLNARTYHIHMFRYTHFNGTKCWITTNYKNPQFETYYEIHHVLKHTYLKHELTVNSKLKHKTTQAILNDLIKYVAPTHIKNIQYNYYKIDITQIETVNHFENMLRRYINTDPLVHVGNYIHKRVSTIQHYNGIIFKNGVVV